MNPPTALGQITLIDTGFVDGSFVLDLGRLGLVGRIAGVDLNRGNLDRTLRRDVIDEALDTVNEDNIVAADSVLIATPASTLSAICRSIVPFPKARTLVSDVGSTK